MDFISGLRFKSSSVHFNGISLFILAYCLLIIAQQASGSLIYVHDNVILALTYRCMCCFMFPQNSLTKKLTKWISSHRRCVLGNHGNSEARQDA